MEKSWLQPPLVQLQCLNCLTVLNPCQKYTCSQFALPRDIDGLFHVLSILDIWWPHRSWPNSGFTQSHPPPPTRAYLQGVLEQRMHGCIVVIGFHASAVVPFRPNNLTRGARGWKTENNGKHAILEIVVTCGESRRNQYFVLWDSCLMMPNNNPSGSPQRAKKKPNALLVLFNWPTSKDVACCHVAVVRIHIDQPIPRCNARMGLTLVLINHDSIWAFIQIIGKARSRRGASGANSTWRHRTWMVLLPCKHVPAPVSHSSNEAAAISLRKLQVSKLNANAFQCVSFEHRFNRHKLLWNKHLMPGLQALLL